MSIDKWIMDNCYETLWVDHEINSNSVVVEFGGYLGRWSDNIKSLYCPNLYIFEPVTEFYETLKNKFIGDDKVRVLNEGVSIVDEEKIIYVNKDSSSILNTSDYTNLNYTKQLAKFRSIENIIKMTGHIDLCQINIEGYEYELLNYLLDTKKISNISKIIIEFHFERNIIYQKEREDIQRKLENFGYKQIWNYDWAFECWEKIDNK